MTAHPFSSCHLTVFTRFHVVIATAASLSGRKDGECCRVRAGERQERRRLVEKSVLCIDIECNMIGQSYKSDSSRMDANVYAMSDGLIGRYWDRVVGKKVVDNARCEWYRNIRDRLRTPEQRVECRGPRLSHYCSMSMTAVEQKVLDRTLIK